MSVEDLCLSLRADVAALTSFLQDLRGCGGDARHVFDDMERRLTSSKSVLSTSGEARRVLDCFLPDDTTGGILHGLSVLCERMRVAWTDAEDAKVLKRTMSFFQFVVESFHDSVTPAMAADVHGIAWRTFLLLHFLSKHTELQAECLSVVDALLRHCDHCFSATKLDVTKLVDVYMLIVEKRTSAGQRLKSVAMRLLGYMCKKYSAVMSSHAVRILHGMVSVGRHLLESNEVEQVVAEGLLLAFADYTEGFPLVFNGPDRNALLLMHHLTKRGLALARSSQNYRFCKTALALLGSRADQLKECLMDDAENYFTMLQCLWCHKNVSVRRSTYAATAGFFRALSLLWSHGKPSHSPLPSLGFMLTALKATLQDSKRRRREVSFAVTAFGYMAKLLASWMGVEYLSVIFREMVGKCEALLTPVNGHMVEDATRLLPYFLTSLALMLLELPPMGSELPQLLNIILYMTLYLYPHEMYFTHACSMSGPALLKFIAAICQCHGVEFALVVVARQLLTLACCSSFSLTSKKSSCNGLDTHSIQRKYLGLWESLLAADQQTVADWGFPWTLSFTDSLLTSLQMRLRREFISEATRMLRRFDLSRVNNKARGENDLHVVELEEVDYPSANNYDSFLRFVPFLIDSFGVMLRHTVGLEEEEATTYLLDELVAFITRWSHIPGGYKCLHAVLQTARRRGLSLNHAKKFLILFAKRCLQRLMVYADDGLQLHCALCIVSMSYFCVLDGCTELLHPIEVVLRHATDNTDVTDALEVLDCCLKNNCAVVMPHFFDLLNQPTFLGFTPGRLYSLLGRYYRGELPRSVQCVSGHHNNNNNNNNNNEASSECFSFLKMREAKLPLLMGGLTVEFSLGSLFPRLTVLSSQATDCRTVCLAACEVLHAVMCWCIQHESDELYGDLFFSLIIIRSGAPPAADKTLQSAWGVRLRRCVQWFALRGGTGAKEVEKSMFRGCTTSQSALIRRVAMDALADYAQWSVKHNPSIQTSQKKKEEEEEGGKPLDRVLQWVCLMLSGSSVWDRLGASGVLSRLLFSLRNEKVLVPFAIPFARALLDAFTHMQMNGACKEEQAEDDVGASLNLSGFLCRCVMFLEDYIVANDEFLLRTWQRERPSAREEIDRILCDILLFVYRPGAHATTTTIIIISAVLLRLFVVIYRSLPECCTTDERRQRLWLSKHYSLLQGFYLHEICPEQRIECGLRMYFCMLLSTGLVPPTLKRMRVEDAPSVAEEATLLQQILESSGGDSVSLPFIARHLHRLLRDDNISAVTGDTMLLSRSLPQFAANLLLSPTSPALTASAHGTEQQKRVRGHDLLAVLSSSFPLGDGGFRKKLIHFVSVNVSVVLALVLQPTLLGFFLSDARSALHHVRCLAALVDVGLWSEACAMLTATTSSLSLSNAVVMQHLLDGLLESVRNDFVVNSQQGSAFCHTVLLLLLPPFMDNDNDVNRQKGGDNDSTPSISNGASGRFELHEILTALQKRDEEECPYSSKGTLSSAFLETVLRGDWRDADKNSITFCSLFTQLCHACAGLLQQSGGTESSLHSPPFMALRGLLCDIQHGPRPTRNTCRLIMRKGIDPLMRLTVPRDSASVLLFFLEVHRCCLRLGDLEFLAHYEHIIFTDIHTAVDSVRWTRRPHALLTSRTAVHMFLQGVGILCDASAAVVVAAADADFVKREQSAEQCVTLARQLMSRVINDELPLEWGDISDGGLCGAHYYYYACVVKALIRLVSSTAVLDATLLLPLIPLLHQTGMPQYNALVAAVHTVLQELSLNDGLVQLCYRCMEMQLPQQCGLPWAVWWGMTHRLLLPSLRSLHQSVCEEFFLHHVARLVEEARRPPHETMSLQRQIRALIMLEAMYAMLTPAALRGPINAAFIGKKEEGIARTMEVGSGRELTLALIKSCCAARVFLPPNSSSSEMMIYDALTYRQSAHRCLVAILIATQEEEKVFTKILLGSHTGDVWNHIVDTSQRPFLPVETNFPYLSEHMAKNCTDWELRQRAALFQRHSMSNVKDLREESDKHMQDVFTMTSATDQAFLGTYESLFFNHPFVSCGDDKVEEEKEEEEEEYTVKLDFIWTSTCSGALFRLVDFFFSKFPINLNDGWVKEMIGRMLSPTVHTNAKLVLARLVQLRASSFASAANLLRDSLVSLICDESIGGGDLHYMARDLLELLISWAEKGKMGFTDEAKNKLMAFLLRAAPYPKECVMQQHLNFVRRLLSLSMPSHSVRDVDVLRLLRGDALSVKFGLQLCGLLIDNGVLLSLLAPNTAVELYQALASCVDKKGRSMYTDEGEDVTEAADVIGRELNGLQNSTKRATLLRDTVKCSLLCLWSHNPGVALRALRAIVQHDTSVLNDIPISTLLSNFMSHSSTEQMILLHVLGCIPERTAESYSMLQILFIPHFLVASLSDAVRVALYRLFLRLLPLLAVEERRTVLDVALSPDAMHLMSGSEETSMLFFALSIRVYMESPSPALLATVIEGLSAPLLSVQCMVIEFLDAHVLPRDSCVSRFRAINEILTSHAPGNDASVRHTAVLMLSLCHSRPRGGGGDNNSSQGKNRGVDITEMNDITPMHIDSLSAHHSAAVNALAESSSFNSPTPFFLHDDPATREDGFHVSCSCGPCSDLFWTQLGFEGLFSQWEKRKEEEEGNPQETLYTRISSVRGEDDIVGFEVLPESFVVPLQVLCLHDTEMALRCLEFVEKGIAGLNAGEHKASE